MNSSDQKLARSLVHDAEVIIKEKINGGSPKEIDVAMRQLVEVEMLLAGEGEFDRSWAVDSLHESTRSLYLQP